MAIIRHIPAPEERPWTRQQELPTGHMRCYVINTPDGQYFQIDTLGQNGNAVNQTMRFSPEAIAQLRNFLENLE